MILVDTSVMVAWLDPAHEDHQACRDSLEHWAGQEELAVSSVSYGELAAGGRTRQAVDEDLRLFGGSTWILAPVGGPGPPSAAAMPSKGSASPCCPTF
jgi:hypothetical protein